MIEPHSTALPPATIAGLLEATRARVWEQMGNARRFSVEEA